VVTFSQVWVGGVDHVAGGAADQVPDLGTGGGEGIRGLREVAALYRRSWAACLQLM
jgi:hypothetical protein